MFFVHVSCKNCANYVPQHPEFDMCAKEPVWIPTSPNHWCAMFVWRQRGRDGVLRGMPILMWPGQPGYDPTAVDD